MCVPSNPKPMTVDSIQTAHLASRHMHYVEQCPHFLLHQLNPMVPYKIFFLIKDKSESMT